jgi:hypothetical protein
MQCPRCTVTVRPVPKWRSESKVGDDRYLIQGLHCPACQDDFAILTNLTGGPGDVDTVVIWPRTSNRQPVADEVPPQYASLAREAALTLGDSPRASAALSRRCLQQLLRDEAGAPPGRLYDEIEWVIAKGGLPAHAVESLHSLREIGNMAAHPNKSTATGDYLEVEPGEAEWTLDLLDTLFDHYFVAPARTAARKAALDARLGRPAPGSTPPSKT